MKQPIHEYFQCFGLFWPLVGLFMALMLIAMMAYVIVLHYQDRQRCRRISPTRS